MKRFIIFVIALAFLLVPASSVLAQEETLPEPGITPDSPLYFLDTLGENISLFFAFSAEAKAEKAAEIAGEKAAEAEAMVDEGKTEEAVKAADRYGVMISTAAENLAKAAQSGEEFDAALAELVAKATSIHLTVLADVYNKVPEQAKPAIERAMQQGETGATEALNALGEEGRPDVDQIRMEVQQKVEEARQQRGMTEGAIPEGIGQPQGVEGMDEDENGGPPIDIPAGRP